MGGGGGSQQNPSPLLWHSAEMPFLGLSGTKCPQGLPSPPSPASTPWGDGSQNQSLRYKDPVLQRSGVGVPGPGINPARVARDAPARCRGRAPPAGLSTPCARRVVGASASPRPPSTRTEGSPTRTQWIAPPSPAPQPAPSGPPRGCACLTPTPPPSRRERVLRQPVQPPPVHGLQRGLEIQQPRLTK